MQAYATAEPLLSGTQLRSIDRAMVPGQEDPKLGIPETALFDGLLARLADLVVDRLAQRMSSVASEPPETWMDARAAAEYLGVHRDTVRKLAAERAIPVHQDGAGCKLFFRRDELDEWRQSSRTVRSRLRAVG